MGKLTPGHQLREELREFLGNREGVEEGKGALSELVRRAVGRLCRSFWRRSKATSSVGNAR